MSTLFDFIDDGDAEVLCALMPWMGTACGRCVCGGCSQCAAEGCSCVLCPTPVLARGLDSYSRITCPDCLALGDLHAIARESQRPERLAPVVA